MDTGIGYFPTHDARAGRGRRLVEEHGHAAIYFAEHTHIPAARETPYAGGGELPRKYCAHLRPVRRADGRGGGDHPAAGRAAGSASWSSATRSSRPRRSPASTTSPAAGSSSASAPGGTARRWPTTAPTRAPGWRCWRERVEAMKAIWTQDEASYDGEYVDFDRIWSWPKPAQRPYPPVLVGGDGPTVLDRVLGYADGWFPNFARDDLLERIADWARDRRHPGAGAQRARRRPGARAAGAGRRAPGLRWVPSGRARGRARPGAVRARDRRTDRAVTPESRFAAARVARLATSARTAHRTWYRSSSPWSVT